MSSSVTKLNKTVTAFFTENGADLEEAWMSPEFQQKLKSLFISVSRASQKRKDKNAPKRGKSAYLFFCAEHREAVKEDLGPECKATEITAELGKRWNALKDDPKRSKEKARFVQMAVADKERYEDAKANYTPSAEDEETTGGKPRKRRGPKTGPKRAKSAYLCFCEEERPKIKAESPDMQAVDVTKELGVRWTAIKAKGEKHVAKYNQSAAQDKARYEKEKAEQGTETKVTKSAPQKSAASPKAGAKQGKASSAKPAAKGKAKPAVKPAVVEPVEDEDDLVEEEDEPVEVAAPPPKPAKGKPAGKGKGKGKGKK